MYAPPWQHSLLSLKSSSPLKYPGAQTPPPKLCFLPPFSGTPTNIASTSSYFLFPKTFLSLLILLTKHPGRCSIVLNIVNFQTPSSHRGRCQTEPGFWLLHDLQQAGSLFPGLSAKCSGGQSPMAPASLVSEITPLQGYFWRQYPARNPEPAACTAHHSSFEAAPCGLCRVTWCLTSVLLTGSA